MPLVKIESDNLGVELDYIAPEFTNGENRILKVTISFYRSICHPPGFNLYSDLAF
jgi:hypothetical protein